MKNFYISSLMLLIFGCSEPPPTVITTNSALKEALLRTRNVYSVDKNMDQYNPLEISFYQQHANQLVELNITTANMNDYYRTVVNSDPSLFQKKRSVSLGELAIEFDGHDVTECVITECNSTNCLGSETDVTTLNGSLSTASLYLNLSKMSQSSNLSCAEIDLTSEDTFHRITFREKSLISTGLRGTRLKAQVILYNRTNLPQHISSVFE